MARRPSSRLHAVGAVVAVVTASYSLYRMLKYTALPTEWIYKKKLKRYPGNLPILGNSLTLVSQLDTLHDKFSEAFEANDDQPMIISTLNSMPGIMINDPVLMEHVFKTHFEKYEKRQRKLAANIFNVKNFRDFVEHAFAEKIHDLVVILDGAAERGELVNLNDLFFRFTLDGFCKIAFGTEIHCLTASERPVFAASFDRAQINLLKRFVVPFAKLVELLTPSGWQFRRDLAVIREFSYSIVDRRIAELAGDASSTSSARHDLLTYMMQMRDASGGAIGRAELSTNLINFLFAGRDTTGLTLTWTFLLLARHPSVLDKLLAEIDAATAGMDDAATVSYDVVRSLPYANAVMHETLRLYPPVPYNMKQAVADDVLPNGAAVSKGMMLSWGPYALGRSKKIWGEDAREFRPERWLEMAKVPSAFAYNVFNAGPRICLGKSFAEIEVVFVLVELLRRFSFGVRDIGNGPGGKKTYTVSATLAMEGGELLASVTRRRT
ncbi:cytochrome P450 [Zopfochytrium polystomum]|nr:cytochrome P450 [Zopfochytrium polystomum]